MKIIDLFLNICSSEKKEKSNKIKMITINQPENLNMNTKINQQLLKQKIITEKRKEKNKNKNKSKA